VTKRAIRRTVVNVLGDGHSDVYADADAAATAWELRASGLTAAEWDGIETLFQSTSGMWQTFTFLDPAGNLVAYSEDFAQSAWVKSTLTLGAAVADPFRRTRATSITSSGSNGHMSCYVLPDGGASSWTLCGSALGVAIWTKDARTLTITEATGNADSQPTLSLRPNSDCP